MPIPAEERPLPQAGTRDRRVECSTCYMCACRCGIQVTLEDGDWAWVESPHGRLRCRIRTMEGVEPGTVWTWNAIGKQGGARGLAIDAPEATTGFLLNYLISASVAFDVRGAQVPLALLVVVLPWVMLDCTAMIYASLKPIRQWHTRRIPLAFWLLAYASGALLIVVVATAREEALGSGWSAVASALFVLALVAKLEYWRFVARVGGVAAFGARMIGLIAERWLFFAEARHTVRLYHGEATT